MALHVKMFSGKSYLKRDLIWRELASLRKVGFALKYEGQVGVNDVTERWINV